MAFEVSPLKNASIPRLKHSSPEQGLQQSLCVSVISFVSVLLLRPRGPAGTKLMCKQFTAIKERKGNNPDRILQSKLSKKIYVKKEGLFIVVLHCWGHIMEMVD